MWDRAVFSVSGAGSVDYVGLKIDGRAHSQKSRLKKKLKKQSHYRTRSLRGLAQLSGLMCTRHTRQDLINRTQRWRVLNAGKQVTLQYKRTCHFYAAHIRFINQSMQNNLLLLEHLGINHFMASINEDDKHSAAQLQWLFTGKAR